eukprot:TCALIF_06333-PA protein Name:"Similar to Ccdc40 Coiled-coil domain-containing protein 40 (Mus musculus)" AED:0.16 eAED:0.16 QI:0/0.5/0/0.66/1/1/3/0/818
MEADHPKLQAFQKALNQVLNKRVEETELKIKALRQEKEAKAKLKTQKTKELYEAQSLLKKDEKKLMAITEELHEVTLVRRKLEHDNQELEQMVHSKLIQLRESVQRKQNLKDAYNQILYKQILFEARRVDAAGDVNASNTMAAKTAKDFNQIQEEKRLQDLYLDRLQQKIEDMERQSLEYREQTIAVQEQTQDMKDTLRKAEDEVDNVKKEKSLLLQKWTNSILNVSKQDESIQSLQSTLHTQELDLKRIRAEMDGTKKEIVEQQETHEQKTSIEQRLEKLASQRKAQIKRTEESINDARTDLTTAQEARRNTLNTLEATESEVKQVEHQIQTLRKNVETLDKDKIELEDQIFLLCRDQSCAEKTSKYADKIVQTLRNERSDLESKLAEFQNQLSVTTQKIYEKQAMNSSTLDDEVKIKRQNDVLNKTLDKLEQKLTRTQALIDKRQSAIDLKHKLKAELTDAKTGQGLSPLENELRRVQMEITDVTEFCNQAKIQWIKYQQQFIERTNERSSLNEILNEKTRKYLILEEKKRKLEKEMIAMEQSVDHIQRRLEAKDGYVGRLNAQIQNEQARYEDGLKILESKEITDLEALESVQKAVDDLQTWVSDLDLEIETEKQNALEAEAQMVEWEDRMKACKDTHDLISSQRGREGELEGLRSEVHRLQLRLEQVERQSKVLIENIQNTVQRRETLVDKAANNSHLHQAKKPQLSKSMMNKKIEDLKAKFRKVHREEQALKQLCTSKNSRHEDLEQELEHRGKLLKSIRQTSEEISKEIEAHHDLKDTKLAQILQLQTRSKWYRSVKERKYKMYSKSDEKRA